ncbi:MAG: hypothetical protein JJT94_00585 [Bernardetiaceae bacterium]|nr:hypothetical protein [Bernardetiaceae bacterium]
MLTKNKVIKTDIVKYLYGEVSTQEARRIEAVLADNPILKKEYEMLKQTQKQIDNSIEEYKVEPSQSTLNNILNYANRALKKNNRSNNLASAY